MRFNRFFLMLSIIIFSLTACEKDDPVAVDPMTRVFNVSFSRNALAYVNIPVGKYFIYKNVATGALDSVAVTTSQLGTTNFPKDVANGFPEHNMETYRSVFTKYNLIGGVYIPVQWIRTYAITDFSTPYDSTSTADVRLELSGTDQTIFYASHNVAGVQSLLVEGVNYPEVVKAESTNGFPVNDPSYEKNVFYWAKNVGIVKRVITRATGAPTELNLLRRN
ncbi:MAG: hypothetical protein EOO06_04880 [Chitinophagaceae bacterium]|nr:MAG: hypothetical protein EOO06_04880 [Chitinophagaceae bacterium]